MGELSLIQQFRARAPSHPWQIVGPGQDCAVLRWPEDRDIAYKIDQVVEGTHFVLSGPGAATPRQVGWKAMAKTCSDIAAAGCWPVAAMVAVNLARGCDDRMALELYEGVTDCCRKYGFALSGGDMAVSRNGLSVSVSMMGECLKGCAWVRSGARTGDALIVTGALGGSIDGKHLAFEPRLDVVKWIRERFPNAVHACIDITDGLSRDLRHLCDESECGAVVFEDLVPISEAARSRGIDAAFGDGEDFELLLAVDSAELYSMLNEWRGMVPLTHIGQITDTKGRIVCTDKDRLNTRPMPNVGYEHNA